MDEAERVKRTSIVTFHRVYPAALSPMRGDKTALGAVPTGAFQYCEAMRSASAFGWYIFPPISATLRWDGAEVVHKGKDGRWHPLSGVYPDEEFSEYWDTYAPDDLKGWRLPFLSSLSVPGIVQVWSGLLVSTAEGWSMRVRPLANTGITTSYACFEGLIETDRFKPYPLFVNIKLLATDREMVLSREKPLFQVQPVHRDIYADTTMSYTEYEGIRPRLDGVAGMSMADWEGLRRTIRFIQAVREVEGLASYGANVRRRGRSDPE